MSNIRVLWADDEINHLKAHIMFLERKGYSITAVSNGHDAVDYCKEESFDVVFLDESMPGITGLETLTKIKAINANLPVVMITKNEAETIMEEAIGAQITDYLIKPVNPNQILLTLKKIIDNKRLVRESTAHAFQQDFRRLFTQIQMGLDHEEWVELYKNLVDWELKLNEADNTEMKNVLAMQKSEANNEFSKFVENNYLDWVDARGDAPTMSHNLLHRKVFPHLKEDATNFLVVIDNLRWDQWKVLQPIIAEEFRFVEDDAYYSILPTSTQYSRNAIFAGLMPSEIARRYPHLWKNDIDEGGKNLHEADFLEEHLKRTRNNMRFSYTKVTNHRNGRNLVDNIHNLMQNKLNVIVYNFVDMLSHARTEMEVLKELASDEAAYRSLTRSWFIHSPLWEALKRISDKKVNLIFTTDHGTIRVNQPSKVIGDRNTTTNLRYKHGRNLQYKRRDVLEVRKPIMAGLPRPHVSSTFIFAKADTFFVYPNNYNHYVNYFKNTFQHGGISLEEVIVPVARFTSK
ncbi:MAG: response regulator [Chitinophagales bacterium]